MPEVLKKTTSARERMRAARSKSGRGAGMKKSTRVKSRFMPLQDAEVMRIHQAATELLSTAGMANPTPQILEVALDAGCQQSSEGRLLFPVSLVEDLIAKAAKSFTVHGRTAEFDWEARSGDINFCSGSAP